MDYTCSYDSPLGPITLAGDGEALIGLWFNGQKHFAHRLSPAFEEKSLPVFEEARRWLELYFAGQVPSFTPKLAPRGTAFQQAVWQKLGAIPYGKTSTYGELARTLNCASARAVGGAVGLNPISLLIPCHRVLGTGGRLTGYAGGLSRKQWLLALEGIEP